MTDRDRDHIRRVRGKYRWIDFDDPPPPDSLADLARRLGACVLALVLWPVVLIAGLGVLLLVALLVLRSLAGVG